MPPKSKKSKTKPEQETLNKDAGESGIKAYSKRWPQGIRGKLKYMTDIPLELLTEIFCYLEPTDLMHLSRANKSLRKILMSRSARPIWVSVLERLGELFPKCPDDMNEPQLVNFLFGYHCHFCGYRSQRMRPAWELRFLVCPKCLNKHFEGLSSANTSGTGETPVVRTERVKRRYIVNEHYVWAAERKQYHEDLRTADGEEKLQDVKTKKRTELKNANTIAQKYLAWKEDGEKQEERAKAELHGRLKAEIHSRLYALGWTPELDQALTPTNKSRRETMWKNLPDWENMTSEPLQDDIWGELLPKFEDELNNIRRWRLYCEATYRTQAAVDILSAIHEDYASKHYITPPPGELFCMPPFQDAIFAVLRESGDIYVDMQAERRRLRKVLGEVADASLPRLIEEWVRETKHHLYSLINGQTARSVPNEVPLNSEIPDASRPDDVTVDATLALARNFFYLLPKTDYSFKFPFNSIQDLHVSFPDAFDRNETPLTARVDLSTREGTEERENCIQFCEYANRPTRWDPEGKLRFFDVFVPVVESVLRGCGLNPNTATHKDLRDVSNVLLRCQHRECRDRMPKQLAEDVLYNPIRMVHHWSEHLGSGRSIGLGYMRYVSGSEKVPREDIRGLLATGAIEFAVPVDGEAL